MLTIVLVAIGTALVSFVTKLAVEWLLNKWDDYHNAYSKFARKENKNLAEKYGDGAMMWPTSLSGLLKHFKVCEVMQRRNILVFFLFSKPKKQAKKKNEAVFM